MLPIDISAYPFILDVVLTNNSGIEVPIDTIVKPIIISGMWNFFAMLLLPSTKKSAPFISNTNPKIIKPIDTNIFSPSLFFKYKKEYQLI